MNDELSLESLRHEIDRIDDQVHDLLMRRTEVGVRIRAIKGNQGNNLRPGREAIVLRRLIARHRGPFSKPGLVRIWREIFAATLRLQEPFSVAAYARDDARGCADLARDQFGAQTPLSRHQSAQRVIDTVVRQEASVGVLPMPREDDSDPWWPHLVSEDAEAPRIIARLPFAAAAEGGEHYEGALVISRLDQEETGRDRSLLALDADEPISLARLRPALEKAELVTTFTARWPAGQTAGSCLHLIEIAEFIKPGDRRITRLIETVGVAVNRTVALGGYAEPFSAQEMAGDKEPADGTSHSETETAADPKSKP